MPRLAKNSTRSRSSPATCRRRAPRWSGWPRSTATPRPRTADAIVALGGDGLMLQTLHRHLNDRVPIYGMNRGSAGFLMNDYGEDDLRERLARAEVNVIHPLAMRAVDRARPRAQGAGHQRGVAVPRRSTRRPSSGSPSTARVRLGRADLRRRAGGDARRLHGLQPLGLRPDPAHQRAAAGAHPHQPVPAAGAGAARCCPTWPRSGSTCWSPTSAP